ncbi:hypothetical protein, partial [Pseudomonas citronellolis]
DFKAAALIDLSTVADIEISNPPWVKFQSAGWVNFPSAPTSQGVQCRRLAAIPSLPKASSVATQSCFARTSLLSDCASRFSAHRNQKFQ